MELNIVRGSKKKREYAESICNFVAEKFMPRMKDNLIVNLEFVTGLAQRENIYGDCIWEDEDYRPREFTIRIDAGLNLRTTLTTIAHEMVHVKQYAKDEMKQLFSVNKTRFKGEYIPAGTNYWDLPWEIEAHGRETGLFIQWAEKENLGHQKWTHDSQ